MHKGVCPALPSRKLAVLKDDEIDRLERASAACTGASRQDVMDSMYNRLEPKPKGACITLPALWLADGARCKSLSGLKACTAQGRADAPDPKLSAVLVVLSNPKP